LTGTSQPAGPELRENCHPVNSSANLATYPPLHVFLPLFNVVDR